MIRSFSRIRGHYLLGICALSAGAGAAFGAGIRPGTIPQQAATAVRPFTTSADSRATADAGLLRLDIAAQAYRTLSRAGASVRVALPVSSHEELLLDLQRFEVVADDARFVRAGWGITQEAPAPQLLLFRGRVSGDEHSTVFLSVAPDGTGNGFVHRSDAAPITLMPAGGPRGGVQQLLLQVGGGASLPEVAEICGVHAAGVKLVRGDAPPQIDHRLRIVPIAIDADQEFVNLFGGNVSAAESYIVQLIAAVSEIYQRDLGAKLKLSFVRTWPNGGEPFGANDISSFSGFWFADPDAGRYRVHQLLSGRRDLGYGGIGYVNDPCWDLGYSIAGLLLGSFTAPPPMSDLGNWDLYVCAHEMGHNFGTYHTHDGYAPPIDTCPSGNFARGTIMSYCHTLAGGLLNLDLRFHRRVIAALEARIQQDCLAPDCNDDDIADAADIALGNSSDANSDGIPDECADCNQDGVPDAVELAAGAADVDEDGIPDSCQPDCNANLVPDGYESEGVLNTVDRNGNNIPDSCEPDCNHNGIADHREIAADPTRDIDRNGVPDVCQDCNANGRPDWFDIQKAHFIYVADGSGHVVEFHGGSGVPVHTYGNGVFVDPQGVAVGPDRTVYVADAGRNAVFRLLVGAGSSAPGRTPADDQNPGSPVGGFGGAGIATIGGGGIAVRKEIAMYIRPRNGNLHEPTALLFAPNKQLLVASHGDNRIAQYAAMTGQYIADLVTAGAGGLSGPRAMALGPDGSLFVADDSNAVRRYDADSGAPLGVFVAAGGGGLSSPRGMLFLPDGRLLVSSYDTDSVLAFDAAGASLGAFSDLFTPTGAWGLALNTRGNLLVVRNTGDIRVLELDGAAGRYIRSFIRGDSGLLAPTGIALMPGSPRDIDDNGTPDVCDFPE